MMWREWFDVWSGAEMLPTLLWLVATALFASFMISRRLSWLARCVWWPLQLAAVFCLLLMVFPPSRPGESGESVLLTTGGDVEGLTADRVMPEMLNTERRVRQQGGVLSENLTVVGHGLTPQQWYERPRPQRVQHDATDPDGLLMHFDLPTEVVAGRSYSAVATLAPESDGVHVEIVGSEGERIATSDSGDRRTLTLPALPAGRRTFDLVVSRDGMELERVAFGVNAIQPELARILLVQDAPGFEGRYFFAWAGSTGAAVAARTQVSEERLITRFVNRNRVSLDRLDDSLLDAVDLVVISGAALGALSREERERLVHSKSGVGVLVLIHDTDDLKAVRSMPGLVARENPLDVIYQVEASVDHVESGLSRLNVRFEGALWRPVFTDLAGDSLIVVRQDNPSFAISLIRDSFRIQGAGGVEAYAELWSPIIERMARPSDRSQLMVFPARPVAYERLQVCVPSSGFAGALQVTSPDGGRSEQQLFESPLRLGQQCAWIWPDGAGWYRFESNGLSTERYVASDQSWSGARSRAALSVTGAVVGTVGNGESVQPAPQQMRRGIFLPWLLGLWLLSWFVQRIALTPRATPV